MIFVYILWFLVCTLLFFTCKDVVSSRTCRKVVREHERKCISIDQPTNCWTQDTNWTRSVPYQHRNTQITVVSAFVVSYMWCKIYSSLQMYIVNMFPRFWLDFKSYSCKQRGPAPLQLYSLATPNGWKVAILLEELGIDYDAHIVNIGAGKQFSSGFGTLIIMILLKFSSFCL